DQLANQRVQPGGHLFDRLLEALDFGLKVVDLLLDVLQRHRLVTSPPESAEMRGAMSQSSCGGLLDVRSFCSSDPGEGIRTNRRSAIFVSQCIGLDGRPLSTFFAGLCRLPRGPGRR